VIHIRTMTAGDIPLGMHLRQQALWNQTEADWQRLLDFQPDGCFVAELEGSAVGTTAVSIFDTVGWIAMVLVDKPSRGRGVGTRLVEHALAYLDSRGVPTVRLDATPLGRPIYEKLGFVAEYELARWAGTAAGGGDDAGVGPVAAGQLDEVCALDRRVTGTNRRRLIERLFSERPEALRAFTAGGQIAGYLWLRPGSLALQIGPAVALSDEAGRALGGAALRTLAGRPIFVDIPTQNRPAMRWAEAAGLTVQRPLVRMRRGLPVHDQPAQLWGSFGPEKG
jgi:GNAT superfamily N-acetyltransferase